MELSVHIDLYGTVIYHNHMVIERASADVLTYCIRIIGYPCIRTFSPFQQFFQI